MGNRNDADRESCMASYLTALTCVTLATPKLDVSSQALPDELGGDQASGSSDTRVGETMDGEEKPVSVQRPGREDEGA